MTSMETRGGLTLEQFAGVRVALACGIELDAVLAQEEIAKAAWLEAERLWVRAIADTASLQLELMQKQRVAEDALARKITPLEDDPAAWTAFLAALSSADDPSQLLQ